jgi:predicted 3-demethylubiquinone-9 3-methyltransferase (glyoxalase superfamily)
MQRITPFLWFGHEAEEAAKYYVSIFPNSRIARQCGWLKDKYGLSWQVVPTEMVALLSDADSAKSQRAFSAMMQMKKLDIDALKRAYAG